MSQQSAGDIHQQFRTIDPKIIRAGYGGTQICQPEVDHQQSNCSHQTGVSYDFILHVRCRIAFVHHTFYDDDPENHRRQDIHCLVTGIDPCYDNVVHHMIIGDFSQRRDDTGNDQRQQSQDQSGSQDLADDIYDRGFPNGQKQDQQKEDPAGKP